MSESILSHKISLCELIEQLDQQSCVDVIQSFLHNFELKTLHDFLIKMIFSLDNTTTESLFQMQSIIINTIEVASSDISSDNTNEIIVSEKKFNPELENETITLKLINTKHNCNENNNYSNLIQLPIDILCETSLYLNEKNIFQFEKTCRIFYQIINNSSYLRQSNTFEGFILTPQRLDQMIQSPCSFYKYCKATSMGFYGFSNEMRNDINIRQAKDKWERALKVSYNSGNNWIETMFKSIKILYLCQHGLLFINKLPVNILFDPIKSNLQAINTYYSNNQYDGWQENVNDFIKKYINFKEKLENEGKSIKILKYMQQTSFVNQLLSIESKHIVFKDQNFDFKQFQLALHQTAKQWLRCVTIGKCVSLDWQKGLYKTNCNVNNQNDDLAIETLRFINVSNVTRSIFTNQELIESLNFHNSVKNLTLNMTISRMDDCHKWNRVLLNLLTKKYYFNLTNLNILVCFDVSIVGTFLNVVDWIFDILKENCQSIKYQFKQLNIAFKSSVWNLINIERYDIIEWNDKIDKQFLDEFLRKCKKFSQRCRSQSILRKQHGKNVQKYNELMNQWLD